MPTKLRPPQINYIQPSRSSTTYRDVAPTRSHIVNIPPNPVKRPEHPIFLESSYESILPSRVEPTESLTFIVGTDQKKQQHSTVSNIKTQNPHATEYSTVNRTANEESTIIVTRVDSSITKVTSTLIPMLNNKTHSETSDLATQFTKNFEKTTTSVPAKEESNVTVHTKPKEVRISRYLDDIFTYLHIFIFTYYFYLLKNCVNYVY